MAKNIPTFQQLATTVSTLNDLHVGTPLSDVDGDGTTADPYLGCNRAGACAPGIGIATAFIDPKLTDWAVLDQAGAARDPQDSQHIGGNGLGDVTTDSSGGDQSVNPIEALEDFGTDVNDTLHYLVADQQAAVDAIFHIASGAVNHTGVQVEVGDTLWGIVPVA